MMGLPYLPSADPQMGRGRARGEQGSGPGASSALPRIQIGQCAVGKEGLRDTHTHTDHEQEGVLPAEFLHWP